MGFAIAANTCNTAVLVLLVATARIVCEAGSMQLLGVRPSVPLANAAGLLPFASVGPAARKYRSIAARPVGRRSAAAAPQHGAQQQMRGVPRCQPT